MTPVPKTVLYVRVSTAEQISEHQVAQAREAGFEIKDQHVITDTAFPASPPFSKSETKGADYSTFYKRAIHLWCAG